MRKIVEPFSIVPRSLPGVLLGALMLAGCTASRIPGQNPGQSSVPAASCAPSGPASPLAAAASAPVVLLGEHHDNAADHRWQLASIEALWSRHPDLVLGFEMFPRGKQQALDQWAGGSLSETAFLQRSDWAHVWGFDPALYLPIFRFARDHRIPMLALNVSGHLVHRVAHEGWAKVPVADREGVGTPAPPSAAYRARLSDIMAGHGGPPMTPLALQRFVDAQLLWDRAMAEAIASQHRREPSRLMVALIGAGHLEYGDGVPHQLAALNLDSAVLLPASDGCSLPEPPSIHAADGRSQPGR